MSTLPPHASRTQHRRARNQRLAFFIMAILGAVIIAFAAARRDLGKTAGETRPQDAPAIKTTGVYADDWMAACGPLSGESQSDCTARLDKQYGRVAGAPVPPAK